MVTYNIKTMYETYTLEVCFSWCQYKSKASLSHYNWACALVELEVDLTRYQKERNMINGKKIICGSLKGERGMAAFTLENFTHFEQI